MCQTLPFLIAAMLPLAGCGQQAASGGGMGAGPTVFAGSASPLAFVRLSGGIFEMGSPEEEGLWDERPQHPVRLSAFMISETEITQAQWGQLRSDNPARVKGDNLPISGVSWCKALHFANALSLQEGLQPAYRNLADCETRTERVSWDRQAQGYRLPTEAEWEYAARAGSTQAFSSGPSEADLAQVAWYDGNAERAPHPVATRQPNAWGLHDMHGNVYEWVWDRWAPYDAAPRSDPVGPASGVDRVVRGGSWFTPASAARAAFRCVFPPLSEGYDLGFRLARSAPAEEP